MKKEFGDVEVFEAGTTKDGVRLIGGTVSSANIIGFEAGTTGYRGGDSGHGGRTVFRIFDISSSDIRAITSDRGGALSVELGGDCELKTIIVALRAIALILEASTNGGTECTVAEQIAEQIAELMGDNSGNALEQRKVEALEDIAGALKLNILRRGRS